MRIVPLAEIEPDYDIAMLLAWYEQERTIEATRKRFGHDAEALKYFPNDYYEKLESWWKSDQRIQEPIVVIGQGPNRWHIEDGWHRFAISHKFNIQFVPIGIIQ